MLNEIRTQGISTQDLSVDSSGFYENYWEDAREISPLTLSKNRALLKQFFPDQPKDKNVLERAFKRCWSCEKIDPDPNIFFNYGLYF